MKIVGICFLSLLLLGAVGQSEAQACTTTLKDALVTETRLTGLYNVVRLAGLADTFDDPDLNVTVFAPNNAAVEELGKKLTEAGISLDNVTSSSNNVAASIILYHVVPFPVTTAMLTNGQILPTRLTGYNLTVNKKDDEVTIETPENDAKVVVGNLTVCRSYVHIIDDVLLPAKLGLIPAQAPTAPGPEGSSPGTPGTVTPSAPSPSSYATTVGSSRMLMGAVAAIAAIFAAL